MSISCEMRSDSLVSPSTCVDELVVAIGLKTGCPMQQAEVINEEGCGLWTANHQYPVQATQALASM